jgi:hypothetical protein
VVERHEKARSFLVDTTIFFRCAAESDNNARGLVWIRRGANRGVLERENNISCSSATRK